MYIKWPVFRQGLNPSPRTYMDPKALTPTQKMELARNRIWGNMVGGNGRSGYKEMKRLWPGRTRSRYYEFGRLGDLMPYVKDYRAQIKKRITFEKRKARIFMRGIKIGNKKGEGS